MTSMYEILQDILIGPQCFVLGALIGGVISIVVQKYISRRAAAKIFREGVIDALGSFYPPPGDWSMNFEAKLRGAVPEIEKHVTKFRYYVPRREQKAYDSDWNAFRSYCLEMNSYKSLASKLYPSMRPDNERNPQDIFYEKLENLLRHGKNT